MVRHHYTTMPVRQHPASLRLLVAAFAFLRAYGTQWYSIVVLDFIFGRQSILMQCTVPKHLDMLIVCSHVIPFLGALQTAVQELAAIPWFQSI